MTLFAQWTTTGPTNNADVVFAFNALRGHIHGIKEYAFKFCHTSP